MATNPTYICQACGELQSHSLAMCGQCYSTELVEIDMEATRANIQRNRRIRSVLVAAVFIVLAGCIAYGAVTGAFEFSDVVRAAIRIFAR